MKKPRLLKQAVMLRMLYALVPVLMVAIYYFGWRIFFLVLTSFIVAFGTEWIMAEQRKGKISTACFVTAALFGLSLPPTTPFWIAAVGAGVAILFGKEVFGGFGRNVFNPAVVGRAFVYVCFPVELTSSFVPVFRGVPGGFSHWSFASLKTAPSYLAEKGLTLVDAITTATPMWSRRDYDHVTGLIDLITGSIGGVFEYDGYHHALAAGSAGEVCAWVILLSGVYLLYTKTAQYRLIAGTLAGAVGINVLLRHGFGLLEVPPVGFTLFSGALLYGAVFMVTDPVSAPNQPVSQWIYSVFIGVMIVFFRWKAVFAGGVAFSILLGNMLAPSLDLWVKRYRSYRKKDSS
jgi:Na+-transporting NADH:ubiquinone oxidoreductase subunit B